MELSCGELRVEAIVYRKTLSADNLRIGRLDEIIDIFTRQSEFPILEWLSHNLDGYLYLMTEVAP